MFCPNCGYEVNTSDNYCPNCGYNLKNVKVKIVKDEIDKEPLSQETIKFKPLKNISGIDSTNELKEIIKAVDEKVKKNISEYEKQSTVKDSTGPSIDNSKEVKDLSIENDVKFDDKKLDVAPVVEKKAQIKETASKNIDEQKPVSKEIETNPETIDKPEVKQKVPDTDTLSTTAQVSSQKKIILQKIKDFINEDDDEYSIFTSFEDKVDIKNENIELTQPEKKNFENTMDLSPIIVETKKIAEDKKTDVKVIDATDDNTPNKSSYNYKSFTELVNAELEKTPPEKELGSSVETEKTQNGISKIKSKLLNTFNKTEKDEVNSEKKEKTEKTSQPKKSDTSSNEIELDKNKVDRNTEKNKKFENDLKNNDKNKIQNKNIGKSTDEKSSATFDKLLKSLKGLSEKFERLSEKQLLIIGIILTILPVIISVIQSKIFSIFLVVLVVVKVLLKILQFYMPLNIAIEKAWIDSSETEVKQLSTNTFVLSEVIMLICFLFSPWYGLFNFHLLPALTAYPVGTIILVIFASIFTLANFNDRLTKTNKIVFIGWYLILFIIFEFFSKLIFMFTNILV